ncbi:MAG: hypothetical protein HZB13_10515, partial [Acidobacteria bacterium]|nr:hypothetical protein [Acidobacteriota bacterium]
PNLGYAHCLGVLWYWWALHEERRVDALLEKAGGTKVMAADPSSKRALLREGLLAEGVTCKPEDGANCAMKDCAWREDCLSSAPELSHMWERVVACWGMLAAAPEFWKGFEGLTPDQSKELKKTAMNTLRESLLKQCRRWDERLPKDQLRPGVAPPADKYRRLDMMLTAELESAETMLEVGVRTKRGPVACGALMLSALGMEAMARERVATVLQQRPASKTLQRLLDLLSPHRHIAMLVNQNLPKEALKELLALPEAVREGPELRPLMARSLFMLASQKSEMGEVKSALTEWGGAIRCAHGLAFEQEIRKAMVDAVAPAATALEDSDRDGAIALLKEALELGTDGKLQSQLAENYVVRGINTFNEAQQKAQREGLTDAVMAMLESGLADLEEAVRLGSKRAVKQAEAARGAMSYARCGMANAPKEIEELLIRARQAIKEKKLDAGIDCLREARRKLGRKTPESVIQMLSGALNARGVQRANQAGEEIQQRQGRLFDRALTGNFF